MTTTILGRLGRDAEVRYLTDGTAVANLALASSYGRKGTDGNRPTQWYDASLWGKQAEAAASYLTKGKLIVATLEDVHIEEFQTKDGTQKSKLVGRVMKFEFAGGPANPEQQEPARQAAPQRQAAQQRQAAPTGGGGATDSMADMESDVPFITKFTMFNDFNVRSNRRGHKNLL